MDQLFADDDKGAGNVILGGRLGDIHLPGYLLMGKTMKAAKRESHTHLVRQTGYGSIDEGLELTKLNAPESGRLIFLQLFEIMKGAGDQLFTQVVEEEVLSYPEKPWTEFSNGGELFFFHPDMNEYLLSQLLRSFRCFKKAECIGINRIPPGIKQLLKSLLVALCGLL